MGFRSEEFKPTLSSAFAAECLLLAETFHVPRDFLNVADLTASFPSGALGYIHLSWRAPVRRTSAMLYGHEGMLEIEDTTVRLTSRSGATEELPVIEEPDNSYHPTWFAALAEEFEAAIAQGPQGPIALRNQSEAATALAMLEAAKASHAAGGAPIPLKK